VVGEDVSRIHDDIRAVEAEADATVFEDPEPSHPGAEAQSQPDALSRCLCPEQRQAAKATFGELIDLGICEVVYGDYRPESDIPGFRGKVSDTATPVIHY
jgi:hypothetical protein